MGAHSYALLPDDSRAIASSERHRPVDDAIRCGVRTRPDVEFAAGDHSEDSFLKTVDWIANRAASIGARRPVDKHRVHRVQERFEDLVGVVEPAVRGKIVRVAPGDTIDAGTTERTTDTVRRVENGRSR